MGLSPHRPALFVVITSFPHAHMRKYVARFPWLSKCGTAIILAAKALKSNDGNRPRSLLWVYQRPAGHLYICDGMYTDARRGTSDRERSNGWCSTRELADDLPAPVLLADISGVGTPAGELAGERRPLPTLGVILV